MFRDFVLIMTAPLVGWISASGLVALSLLVIAIGRHAIADASTMHIVVSCAINLATLAMDYNRNRRS